MRRHSHPPHLCEVGTTVVFRKFLDVGHIPPDSKSGRVFKMLLEHSAFCLKHTEAVFSKQALAVLCTSQS